MLRFGAVTIDVSHPKAFSSILKAGSRAGYTAVFNDGFRGEDEVNAFAKNLGLTVCESLDALADMVDIGMIHACNWDRHLDYIAPFAQRGKPVFIDKPLVGNLKDGEKLLALSRSGAKIWGTSAVRYCEETQDIRRKVAESGGRIIHVTAAVGVDEFNYAIHAFEGVCALIDDKPVSARYLGRAASDKETCDSYMLRFEGGATAVIHNFGKKFTHFHTMVLTDQGLDYAYTVDNARLYAPMLDTLCDALEGKDTMLASVEEMLVPITAALACKASKMADGEEVRLDDPALQQVSFDGCAFERNYAANAAKIYL